MHLVSSPSRAGSQGNVSVVVTSTIGDPVTFSGSVTWCGNSIQQCGDHEVDASTGLVRFQDDVSSELARGGHLLEHGATIVGLPPAFNPIQELASLARRTTSSANGSVIVEASTSGWNLGAFTVTKLVAVVKCEDDGCVGKAVGNTDLGCANASAAVAFSSSAGVEAVDFTLHESSDFITLEAMLHYNATAAGSGTGISMAGSGSAILNLPFDGGRPSPNGTANTIINAANVTVMYSQLPGGNSTLDVSGSVQVGNVSASFAFARTNDTCWTGYFNLSDVAAYVTCSSVDFTMQLHKNVRTDFFALELDATLYVYALLGRLV